MNYKKNISFTLLVIISTILFLTNLGNQYLWQDEAQTCLISKTILEKGLPYGTDGINFFSQELGAEYGENYIWKWHTWLPFYIQAFFFWLFGMSNFVARLPFALFGIGSVIFTYLLSKKLFNKETSYISILLLITNVGFLVLSRQARLYSPSIMLSTASLYYFITLKDEIRNWKLEKKVIRQNTLFFILCTIFLFHTHYFYYATFFISIGLYLFLFERAKIKQFIIPTIISGIINLPWIIWFRDLKYNEQYDFNFNKYIIWRLLKSFSYSTYKNISGEWMIIVLIAVLVVIFIVKKEVFIKKKSTHLKATSILILYSGVTVGLICLFSPGDFFRYLSTLYIPIILLIAFGIHLVSQYHKILAGAIVIGFILINSFDRYLHEITHDYNGPLEGITKHLNDNAKPNDTVLITYGDLPIKWYTGLKTYGGLTGEILVKSPDWIIYRKHTVCEKDQAVKNFIDNNVDLSKYKRIEIPYPDYKFENREDPAMRVFKPIELDNVAIYKK